jgi:hypothetical protein
MPGNIHGHPQYATDPHAQHNAQQINGLHQQISQLTQQVAHLTGMIQENSRHPNPAPQPQQGGLSEQVLIQLLMSERERGDRATEKMIAHMDPVTQIGALSALVDILPAAQDDGHKEMLSGALMGLGQVMLGKMGSEEEGEGDAAPPQYNAPDAPGVPAESDHPLFVAFDPGPEPSTSPPGDMGMGPE